MSLFPCLNMLSPHFWSAVISHQFISSCPNNYSLSPSLPSSLPPSSLRPSLPFPHPYGLSPPGPEAVRLVLKSNLSLESVLLKRSVFQRLEVDIKNSLKKAEFKVFVTPDQRSFTDTVGYQARGALACGYVPQHRTFTWLVENVLRKKPASDGWKLLAIDGCNTPQNLGSMVRSAAALNLDAILLSDDCCDAWYRTSVRVSMGHVATIPIVRVSLIKTLEALTQRYGAHVFGAVIDAGARTLNKASASIRKGDHWVAVVGNEHRGISNGVRKHCTCFCRIPMRPGVDSLSLSVAAAIIMSYLQSDSSEYETESRKPAQNSISTTPSFFHLIAGCAVGFCLASILRDRNS